MKASLALHIIWVCIAAGAYYIGTQRPANKGPADGADAGQVGTSPAGSSILDTAGGRAGRGSAAGGISDENSASRGVSSKDFPALAKLAASSNPVERTRAMAELLEQLNSENAAEILGAMHLAGAKPEQMGSLVYAWAALDGPAAMAFADEMKEHMSREERFGYQSQVVRGWGSADPDA